MADNLTPLPVKTKTAGDVAAKIVDSAGTNLLAVDGSGRITVNVNGTVTVDSELPNAAALSDTASNPTTPTVGAATLVYDGSQWLRARGDASNGVDVDVTRVQGTVTVDTELATAGALGDSVSNPTTAPVGAFLMGWNVTGSVWKRIRINDSNELVVTTSASSGAPTSPKVSTLTSSALAAGGNVDLDATQITDSTTGKLMQVVCSASVPCKFEIKTLNSGTPTVRAVIFTSAANPHVIWEPPHKNFITQAGATGGGAEVFRVTVTNMDNASAADVYATVFWDEE